MPIICSTPEPLAATPKKPGPMRQWRLRERSGTQHEPARSIAMLGNVTSLPRVPWLSARHTPFWSLRMKCWYD